MTTQTPDCLGPVPSRRHSLTSGATHLSALEWGERGEPLVLLHGITSSARAWWRVAPALVEAGYHVYALDMPGHGESETTDDHRIDALAGLAAGAIRALGLERTTLIGHSWGGATALALASGPDAGLLSRVVLIDPAMQMEPGRGREIMPNYMEGVGLPPERTIPALRAANPGWSECDVLWKSEALAQCRPSAVEGLFTGSGAWDFPPRLADVAAPLLLLVADPQFTVIAPGALQAAERALRPSLGRLIVIPGTDHNMLRAGYNLTMPVLLGWLAEAARDDG